MFARSWAVIAAPIFLAAAGRVLAQMSVEEANKRLKERQAMHRAEPTTIPATQRSAETRPATRPALATKRLPTVLDLLRTMPPAARPNSKGEWDEFSNNNFRKWFNAQIAGTEIELSAEITPSRLGPRDDGRWDVEVRALPQQVSLFGVLSRISVGDGGQPLRFVCNEAIARQAKQARSTPSTDGLTEHSTLRWKIVGVIKNLEWSGGGNRAYFSFDLRDYRID